MSLSNDEIKALLGSEWRYTASANGNLKLDFKNLRKGAENKPSQTDQVLSMAVAYRKLQDAGMECTIKLQAQNREGQWVNWPHIWVNRTQKAVEDVDEMQKQLKALQAQIEKLTGSEASESTESPETEEKPF